MIENHNLNKIWKRLNQSLADNSLHEKLYILGGSAFIAHKLITRATVDVDLAHAIEPDTKNISNQIREGLELPHDWLNSDAMSFANKLPKGFKNRSVQIFDGCHLKVYALAKEDLLKLKCLAYFDRAKNRDLEDLLSLCPSQKELKDTKTWFLSIKEPEESAEDIKSFFTHLSKKLRND